MTSRVWTGYGRFGSAPAVAALLATAPLAAQTAPVALTSAVARVELRATMLPTARLDGSSRLVGWHRSDSGEEGLATLPVLVNGPYRVVVYRVEQEPGAARASRRIWIEGTDGALEEVRVGAPVVIRRPGGSQVPSATLRVRADPGSATGAAGFPLRYEIQVRPAL